jgi:HME family heavy-metal exporter
VGFSLPTGYAAVLEGNFRAQEESARTIGLLSLVSLALVFVVLRQRYQSTALALVVMGNIPLALIGSVAALWIAGLPLSVASMVGFITLAGISARNGILKVSHYLNLALHEGERWGRPLLIRGSEERVAPVLMTALSAGLALIPLLFGCSLCLFFSKVVLTECIGRSIVAGFRCIQPRKLSSNCRSICCGRLLFNRGNCQIRR